MFQLGLKSCRVLALAGLLGLLSSASPLALAFSQDAPAAASAQEKQASADSPAQAPAASAPSSPAKSAAKKSHGKPVPTALTGLPSKESAHPTAGQTKTPADVSARAQDPRSIRRVGQLAADGATIDPGSNSCGVLRSRNLCPGALQRGCRRTGLACCRIRARARSRIPKAIEPLNRAKPLAGDLGDYVAYYLGTCYLQTGHQAEGLAALANFSTTYPDSLLVRDAHLSYANALLTEDRASEAAEILEKDRLPARSDIELAVGKAYAA